MKTMEEVKISEFCKSSSYHLNLDTGLVKNYVELKRRQLHCGKRHDSTEEEINPAHEDLVREIALLELDIICLEKYLLSMYRKTFAQRLESLSMKDDTTKTISTPKEIKFAEVKEQNGKLKENPKTNTSPILPPLSNPIKDCDDDTQKLIDSTILRCHSSLSHAACSFRASPSVAALADAADSYHSMPLSMLEHAQPSTSNGSLTEHQVDSCSNNYHNSPGRLSEEMIKCISAIYSQLADPPFFSHNLSSSPISVSSSTLESFPQNQSDMNQCIETSSSDSLNNPFHFEDSKGFIGFLVRMVEVQGLCRDSHSLDGVEEMLKQFRYLVTKLEEVAPKEMRHEEKLAFWINVHNALVMHAFLVHGIPKSNLKRASLLLKSAYNIGGSTVSVDMIQNSILQCQLPRPGQWLQSLFFTKQRFKAGDARKGYAIEHPDPRLRFALCTGNHSDPVLRLYTSKRVFEELEVAKDDYIQANIRVQKEQKLVLPKNVESYIKEVNLSPSGLFETIELALPSYLRKKFQQPAQRKLWKKIDWIPHNFTFRYLISGELVE
ncbi:uncharacterized protein LOC132064971 [Lycium ferocissimum]|uniref:uncharacterized protein LOC132064971 n=1 Tax=Lycium ferocissimum TaxID=112874 RepID=UPI002814DBCD|nr:uncharacterized protein LOC132064971 [Lycium ferocissimum]XP_059314136.1 uncharacterized protein LOC132064971 [Lycium ferocissimum]XP_059314137.1 uncharacterized protein LOC132064971 [Lycium ferocissimum]XP_059314138.1 uncharacterized protein LOC132064971 [Lycium ferocissimum]XP_059314139.1 uncharacterized protein LOC132064971 [Lycium ferocissimum]